MHRLSVSDAAKVLGISVQAVHGRVNRGTLEHEREDGKIYVFLPDEQIADKQSFNTDVHDLYNTYIASLKSEIESLKQDREVWQEEARRKDHIIAALTERIPELPAPLASEEASDGRETAPGGLDRVDDLPREPQEPLGRRSWLLRWFGF